ncbi:MAG: peptidylprolyl isomerase [Pseudomonadota bacterium]
MMKKPALSPRSPRFLPLALAGLAVLSAAGVSAQGLRFSGGALGGGSKVFGTAPTVPAIDAGTGVQQADFIVAVVNSEPITNSEVRLRTDRAIQQLTQQNINLPPRDQLVKQVLERIINEKAQLQLARENGIKVDDSSVDQAEQNVARQNDIDVPELRRRLASDGIQLNRFRDDLRNQLLLLRLRQQDVEARVRVSDADVDQYIRDQQSSTETAAMQINLAHILVQVPEGATPQQIAPLQQKAQQVADRARAGEDFATLARENSDAPEGRSAGGLLGLRPADRYPQLFVDAVADQQAGAIVGPLRSSAGFHVLKVVEKVQGGTSGTSVLQSHARHILLRTGPQLSEAAAIAQLADYKRRVQSGQADFGALAKEHSQDGSAKAGGDLGWSNPGSFVPEFEEVMDRLAPNEISEPFVSRFGVHLIQVMERRPHTLSVREQRDMARAAAREKKLDEAVATWAQETRGRAYVEYREPPQ